MAIDWSAWATLVAGLAAVFAAVIVGRRQVQIAARQAETADRQAEIMAQQTAILAQQIEIEHSKVRSELYDRRTRVYAALEQYLSEVATTEGKPSNDIRGQFFDALAVSRYLLDENVETIGRAILATGLRLRMDSGKLDRMQDGSDADRNALYDKVDGHHDNLTALHQQLGASKDIHLKLGINASGAPSKSKQQTDPSTS